VYFPFLTFFLFPKTYYLSWTRSSVAFIETKLRAGRSGVQIPAKTGDSFSLFQSSGGPTQPPIQWVPVLFLGDKA